MAALAAEQPDGRAGKRVAAGDGDPEPGPPAKRQQPSAAPTSKRKAAEEDGGQAADKQEQDGGAARRPRLGGASPAPLPRVAVRPRWEQAPAAAPSTSVDGVGGGSTRVGAAIGSPAPSPYRLMSHAKAGAAPLNQLPGYQFSRAARPRRSSAASDASTAASGGSAGGAPQPLYRRKLAAPPSRLGGEPCLLPTLQTVQTDHALCPCLAQPATCPQGGCSPGQGFTRTCVVAPRAGAGTPGSRGLRARLLPAEASDQEGGLSEFDQLLPGGHCMPPRSPCELRALPPCWPAACCLPGPSNHEQADASCASTACVLPLNCRPGGALSLCRPAGAAGGSNRGRSRRRGGGNPGGASACACSDGWL